MTDEPQSQSSATGEPVTEERPAAIPPPVPPAAEIGPSPLDQVIALAAERPEVAVGGAFAGGVVFALILQRLGR